MGIPGAGADEADWSTDAWGQVRTVQSVFGGGPAREEDGRPEGMWECMRPQARSGCSMWKLQSWLVKVAQCWKQPRRDLHEDAYHPTVYVL